MKRIKIVTIALMLFSFSIYSNAQLKIGVKGGLNYSSMPEMVDFMRVASELGLPVPGSYAVKYASAFHLGLMSQYNLSSHFFFQPELLFSMQGVKEEAPGIVSETSYLNFLKLPVYIGYKIKAGAGLDIIIGAGPYAAYGLSGSEGAYGDTGLFRNPDAGFSCMGGIQLSNLQITAGFDAGLVDQIKVNGWKTAKDILGLSSIQTRNFKLSVGYFFN